MALQLWETLKEAIVAYTGLFPATFFTILALLVAVYHVASGLFGSSHDHRQLSRNIKEMQLLPPPVQFGEITEDTRVGRAALVDFFSGLPLLEELVLDVCNNMRDSGLALEVLGSKCPRLRLLKLGQFHGICSAIRSKLDGICVVCRARVAVD